MTKRSNRKTSKLAIAAAAAGAIAAALTGIAFAQPDQDSGDPHEVEKYGGFADDNPQLTDDRDRLDYPPEAKPDPSKIGQDAQVYPETIEDAPSLPPQVPNEPAPYAKDPTVYGDFDNPQVRE
jgi:hypothetical protein